MKKEVLILLLTAGVGHFVHAQDASGNTAPHKGAASNMVAKVVSNPSSGADSKPEKVVAGDLVAKAVKAYNERNINAYLACFSPEVEVYNAAGVLMFKGRERLREAFEAFAKAHPNAKRQIIDRTTTGNKIIEREQLTGLKGLPEQSVTSVYEMENGLIKAFYFVADF